MDMSNQALQDLLAALRRSNELTGPMVDKIVAFVHQDIGGALQRLEDLRDADVISGADLCELFGLCQALKIYCERSLAEQSRNN
jgi:hypothetical protein